MFVPELKVEGRRFLDYHLYCWKHLDFIPFWKHRVDNLKIFQAITILRATSLGLSSENLRDPKRELLICYFCVSGDFCGVKVEGDLMRF